MSIDSFEQLPLFLGLNHLQLEVLRPLFTIYECCSGTVLFKQNDPVDYLYLMAEGEVIIHFKPEDGEVITITHVRSGGVVGWSAVIGRNIYTSGAICTEHSRLFRIRSVDLNALHQYYPEIGSFLFEQLANLVAQRGSTQPQVVALLNKSISGGI